MITINMQYFGNKGAASGKGSGAGGSGSYAKFDNLSGEDKVAMLKQHSGSLTSDMRDDGIGDEALWDHAKSEGTLLVENKDYTVSDKGRITLKSRERFSMSKYRATQNDSVSTKDGRSTIFQTKNGNYYMDTLKAETSERTGYTSYTHEIRKLNWK